MYRAQISDIKAAMRLMVDGSSLSKTELFLDASNETADAILEQAGRLSEDVLAPLNWTGDVHGSRLEGGKVRTAPGYGDAYAQIAAGGWVGLNADPEFGGMGLPLTWQTAINELFSASCLSLSLCPLLSQGSIDALSHHGSEQQKAIYLPKLISGAWSGTMNLTESQAGTDVGAVRSKAEPAGDGSYRVSGQKIYISWGDNDFAENIVHLVLARLPDAPGGTRGLSLFVVPKFIPNEDGSAGAANQLSVVSLEEKMGLHGSPTCVMSYDGALGWLIDEPNKGMAAMFTMMNNARLGVGVEGVGVAEAATQKALAFALDRRQGKTPVLDGSGAIIDHVDVRRMLAQMRSQTQAARAICFDTALHLDLAQAAATEEERRAAAAMGAFLTPVAKAYGTDVGCDVSEMGVQVHGGMGFIEETGAAQFYRDVRVTAIYEGTNGVQAMDLVGRKLADGGETALRYISRVEAEAAALAESNVTALRDVGGALTRGSRAARRATGWMLKADMVDRSAGATAYLKLIAQIGGGMYLGRAARLSGEAGRVALARFYAAVNTGEAEALADAACLGADAVYAISAEALAS